MTEGLTRTLSHFKRPSACAPRTELPSPTRLPQSRRGTPWLHSQEWSHASTYTERELGHLMCPAAHIVSSIGVVSTLTHRFDKVYPWRLRFKQALGKSHITSSAPKWSASENETGVSRPTQVCTDLGRPRICCGLHLNHRSTSRNAHCNPCGDYAELKALPSEVDRRGVEPLTSAMRTRRSTN